MEPTTIQTSAKRSRITRLLPGGAAVLLSVLLSGMTAAYAADNDDAEKTIHEELRILARVFESTLSKEKLLNHRLLLNYSASVFDQRINTVYIPTVGAIITIPVDFLIVDPDKDKPPEATEAEDEGDLWERFENEKAEQRYWGIVNDPNKKFLMVDIETIEVDKERVKEGKDRMKLEFKSPALREDVEVYIEQALRARKKAEGLGRRGQYLTVNKPGFTWNISVGGLRPYDARKVEDLSESIVSTIGQYGHRLEHLPTSERLLVVIQAPRSAGSDRRLYAFDKSDIMQEKTYDELNAKVEQTDY